jgi:hypothetical protein
MAWGCHAVSKWFFLTLWGSGAICVRLPHAPLANGLRLGQNDVLISHEKKARVGAWPWRRGFGARTDRGRLGRIGDHA